MLPKKFASFDIQIKLLIKRLCVAILAGELIRHEHELRAVIMRGQEEDSDIVGQHGGQASRQRILDRRMIRLKQHPSISKYHAIIEFDDGNRAYVSDKNSLNGTYVNGIQLQSQKSYSLQTGDKIKFGFDTREYTFLNFGLLENRNKDLDKTQADEIVSQFIEDHKLYDMKNLPRPPANLSKQSKASGQSEIELSMQMLIEKLETEVNLLNQKLDMQNREVEKARGQVKVISDRKSIYDKDKASGSNKQQALEKFIIDLQKKYTELDRAIEGKQDQIEELCDKDWGRNLEFMKSEQKLLDRLVLEKQAELNSLQKYTSNLFLQGNEGPNVHLLEEQSKELALTKRLLIERENRNCECTRKWRDLYDV